MKSLVISAAHSGAGKTMITLGLLRALRDRRVSIASAKSGPDYIDPRFHAAASGAPCLNLDAWAMSAERIASLAGQSGSDILLIEGAMGLFDGAPDPLSPFGKGSTADVAQHLGAPIVVVLDVAAQAQTAAALAQGLAAYRPDIHIAGVILNRVGSDRHGQMIQNMLEAKGFTFLGAIPRTAGLETPSRHLGLVQAAEHGDLETFIANAAELVAASVDLDALLACAGNAPIGSSGVRLDPPGQHISVASDQAFAFAYPHLLDDWRTQGAELEAFSPLNDEGPGSECDAVFLPGGYPELHAGKLAGNKAFRTLMMAARDRGALIYGECGGYMMLGESLCDAEGANHAMLGFLPLETSFAERKLHLGYRHLDCLDGAPWTGMLAGHEFHYATVVREGTAERLFQASDSMRENASAIGLRCGRVMGSFAHVIDRRSS